MAAIAAMSAAQMAYRKAVKKTRADTKNQPAWMNEFMARMPELGSSEVSAEDEKPTPYELKRKELESSTDYYDQLAWFVFKWITSRAWFEAFIMCNIALIGVATGVDLQFAAVKDPTITQFVDTVSNVTAIIFTVECGLKLIAESYRFERYFTDEENGQFNTFDFVIVVSGYALSSMGGGALAALRMLRLVRLLTFIKGVQQLRVIVSGLITGMKSVTYIVMLLVLIIYINAILACQFMGTNDPARFGTVAMSMLSLFQVSTLASWTSIAYTSWFGCSKYGGDPYDDANPSMIFTPYGAFEGYRCDEDLAYPLTVLIFFWFYIILTAWVIMSLFIGVITMGMFESFQIMQVELKDKAYQDRVLANLEESKESPLKIKIGIAFADDKPKVSRLKAEWLLEGWEQSVELCQKWRDSTWFTSLVTTTIIVVGLFIGMETDQFMGCVRYTNRRTHEWAMGGSAEKSDEAMDRRPEFTERCEVSFASAFMEIASQSIFTFELIVKFMAEMPGWQRFFHDGWNCLDAFVVLTGFMELTPARVVFESFPVVVLRLLRLLRVFRLAKALPRLRSIVEALMEGFSSVGWICVLIVVFNYIMACLCMLGLQASDPFHFGTLPRAMFTILRIETLDTWDQVLYITMFGCDEYPSGYDFTARRSKGLGGVINSRCGQPSAFGWIGALLVLTIVIIGSFVLPTVLIGIVAISFEEATRKAGNMEESVSKMERVLHEAKEKMPGFITPSRIVKIRSVFEELDANGSLALDTNELRAFCQLSFKHLFGVSFQGREADELEGLFHLIDLDRNGELVFAEFMLFTVTMKTVQVSCDQDPEFAKRIFDGISSKYDSPPESKPIEPFEQITRSTSSPLNATFDDGSKAHGEVETKEESNQLDYKGLHHAARLPEFVPGASITSSFLTSATTTSGSTDIGGSSIINSSIPGRGGRSRPTLPTSSLTEVVETASSTMGSAFGLRAVAVAKSLPAAQRSKEPLDSAKAAAGDAALSFRLAQAITTELLFAGRTFDALNTNSKTQPSLDYGPAPDPRSLDQLVHKFVSVVRRAKGLEVASALAALGGDMHLDETSGAFAVRPPHLPQPPTKPLRLRQALTPPNISPNHHSSSSSRAPQPRALAASSVSPAAGAKAIGRALSKRATTSSNGPKPTSPTTGGGGGTATRSAGSRRTPPHPPPTLAGNSSHYTNRPSMSNRDASSDLLRTPRRVSSASADRPPSVTTPPSKSQRQHHRSGGPPRSSSGNYTGSGKQGPLQLALKNGTNGGRRNTIGGSHRSGRVSPPPRRSVRGESKSTSFSTPKGEVAVAWRRVLGFLQSSPEASLSLEALFDDCWKLDLVSLSHAMTQLGANLNEAQLLAFQRDADVNGDGEVTLDEFLASVETRSASVAGQQASAWHAVGLTIRRLGGVSAFFQSAVAPSGAQPGNGGLTLSQIAAALVEHGCGLDSAQEALVLDALCDKVSETNSSRSSIRGSNSPISVSPHHFSTVLEANTTLAQGSSRSPGKAALAAQAAAAAERLEQLPGLGPGGSAHVVCATAWTKVLNYLASEPSFAGVIEDKFDEAADAGSNSLELHELELCLKKQGLSLSSNELAAFHADCDVNMDGTITIDDFLMAVQRHREELGHHGKGI